VSIDFLRAVNLGEKPPVGEKIVVLGGGNVAFDCARVARRLGAAQVHIACLECRDDMPAACDEIEQGEDEGISVHPSQTATRIICENGKIAGVEFLDVESFSFDEDGAVEIETVENSAHVLDADTVIFAIGQRPEIPKSFGIDITASGLIEIDSYSLETSREGVFAAGDAVTGASSVIKAIASGRKTAIAVDRFLDGTGSIDEKLVPVVEPEKCLGPGEGFAAVDRCAEACILPEERLQSFCKVVQDMDEGTAECESGRCLQCDLRLKIKSVKFWGSY
jgi:NADPH-dependent glutamate synthase beta subunit-like oxidoreductase